jgi:hypothetical protein
MPWPKPRLLDAMRRAPAGVKALETSELHAWLSSFPPGTFDNLKASRRSFYRHSL